MGYLIGDERDKINGFDQLPLGILSLFSNIIGTMGNALVLFVFLRRYTELTNYKIFVVCMASNDFGTCIAHIAKEIGRMLSQSTQGVVTFTCTLGHYMGNSVGMAAVVMALFITVERHRKICTPFKKQITLFQAKVMCGLAFVYGGILNIPMCFMSGYRLVVVETQNVSRCSIKNEYDRSPLPITFLTIQAFLILFSVVFEAVFLDKIRKRLEQQSKFKIAKVQFKTPNPVHVNQSNETLQNCSISTIQSEGNSQSSDRSTIRSDKSIEQLNSPKKLSEKGAVKTPNAKVELYQTKQPTTKQSKKIDLENTKNRRIIRTLSIVLFLLVISYFSFSVFQIYLCYTRYFVGESMISRSWDLTMEYASDIVTINGILNPFVYFFTDIKFRAEVKSMFCCL